MVVMRVDRMPGVKRDSLEVAYRGKVFDVVLEPTQDASGQSVLAEFAACDDVVRVYPVDDENVWLIREKRLGMGSELVLRTVAGGIEEGEEPVVAAERELLEELGIEADSFEVFHESTPMLKALHTVYHVVARGPRVSTKASQYSDPAEYIEPAIFPLDQVENLVWDGSIREDIIAFGLLRLLRSLHR
jgi:ADP-ribose pyrophosphatase